MDVDLRLWTAFHDAKDALLAALEAPIEDKLHISKTLPEHRDASRSALQNTIDNLTHGLHEIEAVRTRLSQASILLTRHIARVQASLSPIGSLPPELLCEIFDYALGPEDRPSILGVSSVCAHWRGIILSKPALFTQANWTVWPNWLIRRWCSRAQGHLLTISVGSPGKRYELAANNEYLSLLGATKPLWRALRMEITSPLNLQHMERFLCDPLPSLETLICRASYDRVITLAPVSMPNIRSINIAGMYLQPSERLMQLTDLTMMFTKSSPAWEVWTALLQSAPALTQLTLIVNDGTHIPIEQDHIILPSLASLTLEQTPFGPEPRRYDDFHFSPFADFFNSFSFPVLETLTLKDPDDSPYGLFNFLEQERDTVPRLTCLIIESTRVERQLSWLKFLRGVIESLCVIDDDGPFLPFLTTLSVIQPSARYRAYVQLQCRECVARLRELVTVRSLSHIKFPFFTREYANYVESRVESLEITDWLELDPVPTSDAEDDGNLENSEEAA